MKWNYIYIYTVLNPNNYQGTPSEGIPMSQEEEDILNTTHWEKVVTQIYDMIGTNTAIINNYGIILGSRIPEFKTKTLIAPAIWDFILNRKKVQDQLNVSSVNSMVLETDKYNLVFTFADTIYLMSYLDKSVDLAQYMPSVTKILQNLDQSTFEKEMVTLHKFDLTADYEKLSAHVKEQVEQKHYPIFKHIVRYMTKKK